MSSQSPTSPETVNVPKNMLVDLEEGFSRLAFVLSNIVTQIENGTKAQQLLPTLRQELDQALHTLAEWRWTKWTRDA
jgi:hypothetical protein